jgi:hypothetical protein
MTLTRKIKYKTHKKTRRQNGGDPPAKMSDKNVHLFNALNLGRKVSRDSNYYYIFNIPENATDVEIDAGFDAIANKIRPLTKVQKKTQEKRDYVSLRTFLRNIKDDILLNAHARKEYDDYLKKLRPLGSSSGSSSINPASHLELSREEINLFNHLDVGWNINPDSTFHSLYEVFNIPLLQNSVNLINPSFVNQGIREISRKIQPLISDKKYKDLFEKINNIKNYLFNDNARQEYNNYLISVGALSPPSPQPSPQPSPPPSPPPSPSENPLLPIPPRAAGADTTFLGTQIPNPLVTRPGPPPRPIIGTHVGKIIQGVIKHIRDNIGDGRLRDDDPHIVSILKFSNDMLDYPESSNLENYIIFSNIFIEREDKNELIDSLNTVLNDKKLKETKSRLGFTDNFNLLDAVQLPDPGVALNPTKILPERLLSLMVLSSRLCPIYKLRTNPEAELFRMLNGLFNNGSGANFNSYNISEIFSNFITTNPTITLDYVKNLINGKTVYYIYKKNYFEEDTEISEKLIKSRLDKWLRTDNTLEFPISFLFSKNTNAEKERLNREAGICETIANFTDTFGNPATPMSLFPPSVFNIEQNDDEFDKLNEIMQKLAPAAISKNKKKNKTVRIRLQKNP